MSIEATVRAVVRTEMNKNDGTFVETNRQADKIADAVIRSLATLGYHVTTPPGVGGHSPSVRERGQRTLAEFVSFWCDHRQRDTMPKDDLETAFHVAASLIVPLQKHIATRVAQADRSQRAKLGG